MSGRKTVALQPSTVFEERGVDLKASWLLSAYSDDIWIVSDTDDRNITKKIDFRYLLADGRWITEIPGLYTAIKSYAFWIRDPRFSQTDDAAQHSTWVRNLMHIAHALSLRGIFSFSGLSPKITKELVQDVRYGLDAVVNAKERVDSWYRALKETGAERVLSTMHPPGDRTVLSARSVLFACNLPETAQLLPRVAFAIARIARAEGRLPPNRYGEAGNDDPLPNQTAQTIRNWLLPLEQLYAMKVRSRIDHQECPILRPFPHGATEEARVWGVGPAQTRLPPPSVALQLMEHAARVVFSYTEAAKIRALTPMEALEAMTACWVIVASFTARRSGELFELKDGPCKDDKSDSCLRGDDKFGWEIRVYIEKTLKTTGWIPVPSIVAIAVELLRYVSSEARQISKMDYLFMRLNAKGRARRFQVARHLSSFADRAAQSVAAGEKAPAEPWDWAPHQFRRFFAVFYFYRFEGASIETLSHFLRHFRIGMTRRYIELDPELNAIWTQVQWGFTGHLMREIVAGERAFSGAMGARLEKQNSRIKDNLRRNVDVADAEQMALHLELLVERKGLVFTPMPHAICSCPNTIKGASTAVCRLQKSADPTARGADFSMSRPSICSQCPHAIIERGNVKVIDHELASLGAFLASSSGKNTVLDELQRERIITLKEVRQFVYAPSSAS